MFKILESTKQTADGYDNLRVAVIAKAIEDYKRALHKKDTFAIVSLERWFLSNWGEKLSGGNGQYIIENVRKELTEKGGVDNA